MILQTGNNVSLITLPDHGNIHCGALERMILDALLCLLYINYFSGVQM